MHVAVSFVIFICHRKTEHFLLEKVLQPDVGLTKDETKWN